MEQNHSPKRSPRRQSPYQRNRRLQGKLLKWLLLGSIALILVLSLLIPDKAFSESENRSLAQRPTKADLLDGTYLQDLGDYFADQFPGRDFWMTVNLGFNKLLGQRESSGVYLGSDDYLMQIPGEPNTLQAQRNLEAVNRFVEKYPELNTVMTVAPNAVTVHADKLPANAPVRDQRQDLAHIRQGLKGVRFVDVTDTLTAHADEYLFYKTDHHWTSLGAYYAFTQIAASLDITPPALSTYTVYPVSVTFEGTLSSKSGSHAALDTVEIFVPDTQIEYYVTYGDSGEMISSLYHRPALEVKDHYTVFFGGNYPRVDITTSADTERSLLVFKDSYANCMIQFLYPYFDRIIMIDPRYYYDNVDLVIKSQNITDVLFLYNLDTYLADASLADVLTTE